MKKDRRAHWDRAYLEKTDLQVSWHQDDPQPSLDLILGCESANDLSVVDVGAGRSHLADALDAAGCRDLTLLDISEEALSAVRDRLSEFTPAFIIADITKWTPQRTWDVWHDRAVFHFMAEAADRAAYIGALRAATRPGSRIVLATFAEDGPKRCSGLEVRRYSAAELSNELGSDFAFVSTQQVTHLTPTSVGQRFRYFVYQRK